MTNPYYCLPRNNHLPQIPLGKTQLHLNSDFLEWTRLALGWREQERKEVKPHRSVTEKRRKRLQKKTSSTLSKKLTPHPLPLSPESQIQIKYKIAVMMILFGLRCILHKELSLRWWMQLVFGD